MVVPVDVAVDVPDDVSDVVAPAAHTMLKTVFKRFPLTCVPCTVACTAWIVSQGMTLSDTHVGHVVLHVSQGMTMSDTHVGHVLQTKCGTLISLVR